MKLLTVVGARPQFIKAAALSRELRKHGDIAEIIAHTGQHFDDNMSAVFFQEMDIPEPAYNLAINNLGHGAMTGRMIEGLEELMIDEKPDCVLVYGDTNSTLAAALAAKKLHVNIAHVEAGLRSFNMKMPEEINRILTDRISDILFCPTEIAVTNLEREGFEHFPCSIVNCGDVMQDAAMYYAQGSAERSTIISEHNLSEFVLCTVHRAENTDDPERFKAIVNALNTINKEIPVVMPLHPRTNKILERSGLQLEVTVVPPLGYFDIVELLKNCSLVMTDSGGMQKEAYFFEKHCVTLRDQTEWLELIDSGVNVLAGADSEAIIAHCREMLNMTSDFSTELYGGGHACERIVTELFRMGD